MTGKISDFLKRSILDDINSAENRLIMVTGGVDTGKTVLVELMADYLAKNFKTAVADLDMGQSHIGPPTTVGWGIVEEKFTSWDDIGQEGIFFVGSLSPFGNLLQSVTGAAKMAEQAKAKCKKVILDTTGLIAEPQGRILKQSKIDLLKPDIVIGLENTKELETIFGTYKLLQTPKIYRVPVPKQVAAKSVIKRSEHRFARFKRYFTGSSTIELSTKQIPLKYTGRDYRSVSYDVKDKAVSFRDKNNIDLAIGMVEKMDLRANSIFIKTPFTQIDKIAYIVIGEAGIKK
jgi:polynucleotide 5'-hydroxyl-kinase GRC3/NOL9